MPTPSEIAERAARLRRRLRDAAERGGYDPDRLRIVAVTKSWPIELARAALEAGLSALGESRVQEAEPKVAALPDGEWHLVGRLQSNKARRAVRTFAVIHSVDSLELLARVASAAGDERRVPRLLLQVNLTGVPSTAGFERGELARATAAEAVAATGPAAVTGLMTIARHGAAEDEARRTFAALRTLRDDLQQAWGRPLPELSMGMSDDAEWAAMEGATLLRIGTALFGARG